MALVDCLGDYYCFIEVGEEELTQWRKDHRESVRRERDREGGRGAESHEEVTIDQYFLITLRKLLAKFQRIILGAKEAGGA